MKLFFESLKRKSLTTLIVGVIYFIILISLIYINNRNSMIYYKISPYDYGSKPLDFFFPLFVSIPFSFYTFYLKKDNFLTYVTPRGDKKKYLAMNFLSSVVLSFLMVFIVNVTAIIFSVLVANISNEGIIPSLSGYILGNVQMKSPILFGVIWSFYKASIGSLICLFSNIISYYIGNLFLALALPYAYVILENFFTSILRIPQFSLTTVFSLNRLNPNAMSIINIGIGTIAFIITFIIFSFGIRCYHEKK